MQTVPEILFLSLPFLLCYHLSGAQSLSVIQGRFLLQLCHSPVLSISTAEFLQP